jgi:hypothetical protein
VNNDNTADKDLIVASVEHEVGKLTDEEIALIQELTPQQQRFAQLVVMSSMTDAEIAKSLRRPKAELSRWRKDPTVMTYIKKLQIDQHKATRQQSIQQLSTIKDRVFAEMMDRFDGFDLKDLPDDTPEWLVKKYAERTAKFAPLRDLSRVFEQIDKQIDNKDLILTVRDDFVQRVLDSHAEIKNKRRSQAKALDELGFESYIDMIESSDGSFHPPNEPVEAKIETKPQSKGLSVFEDEDDES